MPRPILKIFFHDACFDGTASAALFSAFYRAQVAPSSAIVPVGMTHRDGDPFAGVDIDGNDNACVDFRYCQRAAMRWWFDHHATAFQPADLRADFDRDTSGYKFFDPGAPSCTGFMARVLAAKWQWQPPAHLASLIGWADTIDAASFASAQDAVALTEPAQLAALWISRNRDEAAAARYIEQLADEGVAAVVADRERKPQLVQMIHERDALRTSLRSNAVEYGDVVVFDRLAAGSDCAPGFVAYQIFPNSTYTVSLVAGVRALKISVGFNPWAPQPRRHDIGALCAANGGGGHSAVGGVTLRLDEVSRARAVMATLVAELQK